MVDALIVVERSASEHPDIIATMIQKDLRRYFKALDLQTGHIPGNLRVPPVEMVPNHGMAGTISLTSVVLATALNEHGMSCCIFDDDDILNKHDETFLGKIGEAKVVAVSTTYIIARKHISQLVNAIREAAPQVKIVLGGQGIPSLSLDPHSEDDANIFDAVDAVVYGDGEDSFPEVVRELAAGRTDNPPQGAIFRHKGNWVGRGEPREANLETVPVPDYGVLKNCGINGSPAGSHLVRPDYASLEEGRGCVFKCRFCSYHVFSPFRRKSPERIVAEISAVKKQGFDNVSFVGAEFIAPVKHSSAVLQAIIDAKLDMNIWLYARLDLLARNPDLFTLLRKAGVGNLVFGMESGDEAVLKNMKKFYNVENMVDGARLARELGFELMSSIIVGYPGETAETVDTTIDVLTRCNFDQVFLHALNILPDTPLWNMREEFGIKINPKTGFWTHDTMALTQIPQATRHMIESVSKNSDSVFINVIRNLAPGFIRPGSEYDNKKLEEVSKILQRILCEEWSDKPSPKHREALWRELCEESTQLPAYVLDQAGVLAVMNAAE